MSPSDRKLLKTIQGEVQQRPPVWMMRQAGRHLPEYRELRSRSRNFLDFCYSPSLAAEATLQPIRRYGMDGAILFADILLILDAMGRKVEFVEGEGPRVQKIESSSDLDAVALETVLDRLSPVYETVERVRGSLDHTTTLIGFAGAPWTVGVYALEGRGGTDKSSSRLWVYQNPEDCDRMLEILAIATAGYLKRQADAGADVLMLFDSWAEGLADDVFERIIIKPTQRVVSELRAMGVRQPVIGFPRGCGVMIDAYARKSTVQAVGLDTAVPPGWAHQALPEKMPVQGNLDPLLLVSGGPELEKRVRSIADAFSGRPHVFNLGHGILPNTPIEHVERVLATLRG